LKPPQGRIAVGDYASPGEFPWMVRLSIAGLYCGGAIISKKEVLTAAHCVATRLINRDLLMKFLISKRSHIVTFSQVHELFIYNFANDLAVLTVTPEFTFSREVYPVKLPRPGEDVRGDVVLSGFGDTAPSAGGSYRMKKAILPVVPNEECGEPTGTICTRVYPQGVCPVSINSTLALIL
ncbi:unnamed protein product, partial [Ixodes hexagonus]